ncbi:MAG: cell division protein FtsQ/DivIB [Anaerolineae bacterium]
MKRKQRYYRTAALLGPRVPQERHASVRAQRGQISIPSLKMPRIRIPWRLLIPFVVVIGVGAWVAFAEPWYLMWEDLEVKGISSPQVVREIKINSDLLGWHLFQLHPKDAEARLMEMMPQFKDVEVSCGLIPTSCRIQVTGRSPVMTWIAGNDVYWVDREGIMYPAQGERPDLPAIRGPVPAEDGPHSMVDIQQGLAALVALGVPVDQLEYSRERGLIWTTPEGCRIAFGVGPEMAERWRTCQTLMNHLAAEGTKPQVVDVRFPGGATFSVERSW